LKHQKWKVRPELLALDGQMHGGITDPADCADVEFSEFLGGRVFVRARMLAGKSHSDHSIQDIEFEGEIRIGGQELREV